jgi:hypothetical protein
MQLGYGSAAVKLLKRYIFFSLLPWIYKFFMISSILIFWWLVMACKNGGLCVILVVPLLNTYSLYSWKKGIYILSIVKQFKLWLLLEKLSTSTMPNQNHWYMIYFLIMSV